MLAARSPTGRDGAVVFDCDGLLLDTEICWTRAETAVFARYGREFGLAEKQALVGTSGAAAGRILERLLDAPGRGPEIARELYELTLAEVAQGAEPLPGAAELVAALRERRPLGVASNSPREFLETALRVGGFDGAFDVVLGSDDVAEPKPSPDLYLRACELLGSAPGDSVALEDSPTGTAAARAAGMFVIGVPSVVGVTLEADLVVASLADPAVAEALAVHE